MTPIALSNPGAFRENKLDRWLVWFPFIGWLIGYNRQVRRANAAKLEVRKQLGRRTEFPLHAWHAEGFDETFAESVCKTLPTRITYLPNHFFLPTDPAHLLMLDGDGLGLIETEVAVWKALDQKRFRRLNVEMLRDLKTVGDYMRTVLQRMLS